MYATLSVCLDNAAFNRDEDCDGRPVSQELARILRDIAHRIEVHGSVQVGDHCTAFDINDNNVGTLQIRTGSPVNYTIG